MKNIKELLQLLDIEFPIAGGRHHAIMLEDSKVLLMIHLESSWKTFHLSDEDLEKDSSQIVMEIRDLIKGI